MMPTAFLALDMQPYSIGSSCYSFVKIRSSYIRLRTMFIKVVVCLKVVILLSIWQQVGPRFAIIREVLRLVSVLFHVLLPQLSMLITYPSFVQCGIQTLRHVKLNSVPKNGRNTSQELLDLYIFFFEVWYIMQQIQKAVNERIHSHGSHAQFMKLFHFSVKEPFRLIFFSIFFLKGIPTYFPQLIFLGVF